LCSRRRSLEGAEEEEALAVEGKRRSAELGDV
jgi:hypothetical protein